MIHALDPLREYTFLSAVCRLLLAMLCGSVIGYGRSKSRRPAGMRTYIIISIGSAMAVLVTLFQNELLQEGIWKDLPAKFDASRLASQVITGIGFLDAGIILKAAHQQVSGLAIGTAYFELGILGTILVLVAETLLAKLGQRITTRPEYTIEVHYNEKNALDQVIRFCKDKGMAITNLQIHSMDSVPEADYAAEIRLRGSVEANALVTKIQLMPGVYTATDLDN